MTTVNPYESPETLNAPPEAKTGRLKWRLVELLVVVGVIGFLIALLLPARRHAGDASRRANCGNNFRQIALALHNYEATYGSFPPAYTVDAENRPLHSWRTLILPFIEQKSLYDKIDLSKPWDDPTNQEAFDESPRVYRCPSVKLPKSQTTYLAVVAPNSYLRGAEPRSRTKITDNPDKTLMVVEVASAHAVHWMSPQDASEELILNRCAGEKLPHSTGAHAASVSGQIIFLSAKLTPETLRALISIDGDDDAAAQAAD